MLSCVREEEQRLADDKTYIGAIVDFQKSAMAQTSQELRAGCQIQNGQGVSGLHA
jgi:hypothetical protein